MSVLSPALLAAAVLLLGTAPARATDASASTRLPLAAERAPSAAAGQRTLAATTSGTAQADAVRVTQGDAQAVLEAFGNGGFSILKHSRVLVQGAPTDGLPDSLAAIRPLDFWNGNHYCALDWHVILLAIFDGGDQSYTAQNFEALRSQVSIAFGLDGAPLVTDQTASKRFLRDLTAFGVTKAYYFQQGQVLAPDELAAGTHTVAVIESDPYGGFRNKISFTVDAPGTGACL